jgi:glycolate oxidase FAD binding subunit
VAALEDLRAACGDARPAGDADAIASVPARFVAAPASANEAAAVVRAAAVHDLSTVVRGAATKLDWGSPPERLDLVVDTRRLTGVVEHAAGDLIVVVRAGTPLADLSTKLAAACQQLALDAPLPGATVGGTVAVNTSGPRRMAYGTVRDLLIGVTIVRPDGVLARAGGKVVKNVAGYDLGKLVTGSYGTLGLITECAFRLHPVPEAGAVLRRPVDGPAGLRTLVSAVLGAQVVPAALELDAPAGGGLELAMLLTGVPEGVRRRVATARALLGGEVAASDAEPHWWSAYPWGVGDVGLKLTAALSRVPDLVAAALVARDRHGVPVAVRGSVGTGVLYAGMPGAADPAAVAAVVADLRLVAGEASGHAVVLTAPAAARDGLDLWGPVPGLALMRSVKSQFDPGRRFAPGRFVGGL